MAEDPRYTIARTVREYVTREVNADEAEAALVAANAAPKTIRQVLRDLDSGRKNQQEAVALLGG